MKLQTSQLNGADKSTAGGVYGKVTVHVHGEVRSAACAAANTSYLGFTGCWGNLLHFFLSLGFINGESLPKLRINSRYLVTTVGELRPG